MTTMPTGAGVDVPSWTIRAERPIDLDQIHELHRTAFAGPAEAELVDAIRSGPAFVPQLSLVAATDDGSILGHVLVSRIELVPDDDASGRRTVLALAPIAVLPPHQGHGIGTALVREALAIADEREEPFVAVLGAPDWYRGFGFTSAAEHDIRGPYDAAGDAMQVRGRPGTEIPSGTLVYPVAFGSV